MMREYLDRLQLQRYKTIRVLFMVLFVLFVFFYVLLFQRDILAVMQQTWSHGQTTNHPVVTSFILSAVLLLLQWGIKAIFGFRGRWEVVAYLPSFLLLSMFTDVDTTSIHYSLQKWGIIWGGCILLLFMLSWLSQLGKSDKKVPLSILLAPNILYFVISILLCMSFTCHNASIHMELAAYRHACRGETEKIPEIGRRSLETTPSLTALRNVALVKMQRAGSELFSYPQPYGANGMLVSSFTRPETDYGAKTFNLFLGYEPYGGEDAVGFYSRLWHADDNSYLRDLYIVSLLLDRQVDVFSREFPPQDMGDKEAPRHYREAWILCKYLYPDVEVDFMDEEMKSAFDVFMTMVPNGSRSIVNRQKEEDKVLINRRFLEFGSTYWNYFFQTDKILTN